MAPRDHNPAQMITVDFGSAVPGYGTKFLVGLVVLLVCDSAWLKAATGVCCRVYPLDEQSREQQEHTKQRTPAAILVASTAVALVTPVFVADTTREATAIGALIGFLVFAVFNTVEYALWSKWTVRTAAIDIAYGVAVYAFMFGLQAVSVL